jgi:hypothetical protein
MTDKELNVERLSFEFGDNSFSREEFARYIRPYFKDLAQVGRTNYLFVAVYGDGAKPDITGYATNTTVNATINSRVLRCEKTNGKWAVYRLT